MNPQSPPAGASGVGGALDRMARISQRWYLAEPLLFGVWSSHRLIPRPAIRSLRIRRGTIEVNPAFVAELDERRLEQLMRFEAVRILLKHPYERRRPNGPLAWEASNLALQECLVCELPTPGAEARFGPDGPRHRSFEVYYQLLAQLHEEGQPPGSAATGAGAKADPMEDQPSGSGEDGEPSDAGLTGQLDLFGSLEPCDGGPGGPSSAGQASGEPSAHGSSPPGATGQGSGAAVADSRLPGRHKPDLQQHFDGSAGFENTADWDRDPFLTERIDELIGDVEASDQWGSMPGGARERILASLRPKLDYRRVLRAFRASVLSNRRRLTRMKPSRRYGFDFLGSRREFSTSLLFAVDVSGSVSSEDLRTAFGIVNRFFRYGIESIDVIWFDTQVQPGPPLTLSKAQREVDLRGRGGTDFQPLMDYLDVHRQYDGLLIFTDGIAPVPAPPKLNRRTRVCWLFHNEQRWRASQADLVQARMTSAFVLPD